MRIFKLLAFVFAVLSPIITHFVLTYTALGNSAPNIAAYALIAIQLVFVSLAMRAFIASPYRWPAVAALTAGAIALCIFHLSSGLALSMGLPHAMVYLGLLILFSTSLMPGHEPIVTFFARKIHGPLSLSIVNYTRQVTRAWCLFFIIQLLGSAILISLAPLAWWSAFVNLLNIPLVALMFAGERLSRPLWVANPPREYLTDIVHMIKLVSGKTTERVQSRS